MKTLYDISEAMHATGTQHRLVIASGKTKEFGPKKPIRLLTIQEHNPLYVELSKQLSKAGLAESNMRVDFDKPTKDTRSEFLTWNDMGHLNIQTGPAVITIKLTVSPDRKSYWFELGARDLGEDKDGKQKKPWVQVKKTIPGSRFRYQSFEEIMVRNWKKWFKQAQAMLKA